ncbi:ADP-ribose pyrophosphatase [Cohaesibacter sp. ES.047]|uniref:NUDIX domain-containing protein n=1 Tax=Cohaesibacter sp. ES.047 TaxID=1798205 RepID=UPI000BC0B0B1|nr:NUDIX hydrolase [Cohaesibacter sp. ES.047]SNY91919.1 ADP-ribose pyrophosphatase [Cohaesibacter sp. ES.047]
MTNTIIQLATRLIYRNRWMSLREDKVRFPGGHEGIYTVVDKPDFAVIIPVHDDGRLQLVQQYRYSVGGRYWELPQGSWEDAAVVEAEALARGELEEETGYRARTIEHLGATFAAYGFVNQRGHIYLAQGLVPGELKREVTEEDMITASFTMDEVLAMIRSGEIMDSITIGALGYWKLLADK